MSKVNENNFFLGIYNVYSFYNKKEIKEKWLESIKCDVGREIAEAEFLYYEGKATESYNKLKEIIDRSQKESNYPALIGATSLMSRVALVLKDIELWYESVSLLCSCEKEEPILFEFMLTCVFCSIEYYDYVISFINKNYDIKEEWMPQYNYLLMSTGNVDIGQKADEIISTSEEKSTAILIQAYLIKAITSLTKSNEKEIIQYIDNAFEIAAPISFIMPLAEMGNPLSKYYFDERLNKENIDVKKVRKLKKKYNEGGAELCVNSSTPLTIQEFISILLVSFKKTNKQVAKTMNISENTLKYYLKNAFLKLQITKRSEIKEKLVKFNKIIKMGGREK